MRLLVSVATMLAEHYALAPAAPLPTVQFNPHHARAHRFGPAPYLFQYQQRHLADVDITACMRFLLHGMVFRTRDGKPVVLKAHLLRHAFATHAVHVEKIPVDIVGEWLKQKNLDVTDYYSQPTEGMVADAADRYLARIATHLHVGDAVRRSPHRAPRTLRDGPRQGRHPRRGHRRALREPWLLRRQVRLRRLRRQGARSGQAPAGRPPPRLGSDASHARHGRWPLP